VDQSTICSGHSVKAFEETSRVAKGTSFEKRFGNQLGKVDNLLCRSEREERESFSKESPKLEVEVKKTKKK